MKKKEVYLTIYMDARKFENFKWKKNKKKRNHVNTFLNLYKNRYEYKLLEKENFEECLELIDRWEQNKENIEK